MLINEKLEIGNYTIPHLYKIPLTNFTIREDSLRVTRYVSGVFAAVGTVGTISFIFAKVTLAVLAFSTGVTCIAAGILLGAYLIKPATKKILPEKVSETEKIDPKYRVLHQGLNFEGECINEVCSAYKKNVMIPKGLGSFNLIKESYRSACPLCATQIPNDQIKKIGFFDCIAKVKGYRIEPQNLKLKEEVIANDNEFNDCTFTSSWAHLESTVVKRRMFLFC